MSTAHLFQPDVLLWQGRLERGLALRVEDGRVAGVERRPAPTEPVTRLSGRLLVPGLVNAHSHAFQRLIRGRTEFVASGRHDDDFWSWREAMYRAAEGLSPEDVYTASRQAFVEMALAGVTTVGEFHYLHHGADGTVYADPDELALQVIRAAQDVGLRLVLLRVAYARAGFQVAPNPRQRRFIDSGPDAVLRSVHALAQRFAGHDTISVGLAPHSVRAVPRSWLEAFVDGATTGPVHMHVAEQPKELEACLAEHGRRPVELLAEVGLLTPRFTAVHAVHVTPEEVQALGAARAHVCACPSTERNLGDGIVPADALLKAGVKVCLGSDSQATVDLLDEARQLEGHLRLLRLRRAVLDPGGGHADGLARRLFGLATRDGASSLGLSQVATPLDVGAPADFFTVALDHASLVGASDDTLLAALVFGAEKSAVRDVAVAGRLIVTEGRHRLQDESGPSFAALSRRLFA